MSLLSKLTITTVEVIVDARKPEHMQNHVILKSTYRAQHFLTPRNEAPAEKLSISNLFAKDSRNF